jgi:SAM-dependent methyltransferase
MLPDSGQRLTRSATTYPMGAPGFRTHLAAATFDGLIFSYLLRYVADPEATLRELARVVKPGSPIASLEFHVPPLRRRSGGGCTPASAPIAGSSPVAATGFGLVDPRAGHSHYRRYPLEWVKRGGAGFIGRHQGDEPRWWCRMGDLEQWVKAPAFYAAVPGWRLVDDPPLPARCGTSLCGDRRLPGPEERPAWRELRCRSSSQWIAAHA